VLVAEVGRRCLTVGSGSGCGWSRGKQSSRARETASGEGVTRTSARLSGRTFGKGRKPSSSMEGVSVRGKATTFTGGAGSELGRRTTRTKVRRRPGDDGDIRSPVVTVVCGPNKLARDDRSTDGSEIRARERPGSPRGSPGSPHEARVLVFDMWVAEVGRTHLWRFACATRSSRISECECGAHSCGGTWAALDGAPGGRAVNGCAKP
jgi:hypothetical protein